MGAPSLRGVGCLAAVAARLSLAASLAFAQGPPQEPKKDAPPPAPVTVGENSPTTSATPLGARGEGSAGRTAAAASLRNENVYVTRIDNNALRDALVRLGASITMITEPGGAADYYAVEFGRSPVEFPFLKSRLLTGWHGEVFESHQNSVLNSRTFFQVGSVQPSRLNDYGFQVGGPWWKGQALSLEGSQRKTRGMVNGNALVPKPDERTPRATDPATRAVIERFLLAFPSLLPNRTDIDPRALNTNSPQHIDDDRLAGRWDLSVKDSRRLWTHYQYENQFVRAFQLVAGQNPNTTIVTQQAQITLAQPFRGSGAWTSGLSFFRKKSLLVPEPNAVGPQVRFARSLESLGPRGTIPIDRVENTFSAGTQLAWVSGAHRLTGGVEFNRLQLNGRETRDHRGEFAFTDNFNRMAIENFLHGQPTSYQRGLGDTSRGFRSLSLRAYLGDEWRVGARWQFNLGLRFGLETAPQEVNHRTKIPYSCDCNNFNPRFGFAYQGDGWGLIRGAYTISYGQIIPATYQQARFNPPGIVTVEVNNPDLAAPLRGLDTERLDAGARSGLLLMAPNLRDPYSHQYTLSWEKHLSYAGILRLGYVGSRSFQLFSPLTTNRARPAPDATTANVNERRPDPRFFEVTQIVNMAIAYLDAAQASLTFPLRKGLTFTASYTFGKAIDTGADYTSTGSEQDVIFDTAQSENEHLKDLKGLSRFDSTHAVLLHFSYDLPAAKGSALRRGILDGWSLSGAALFKTGTPFSLRMGSDSPGIGNVDGRTSERPNLLDPSVLGRTIDHPDTSRQRLPRAAFGFLRPGEQRGNLGRGAFRKDGIDNLNLAVAKQWLLPAKSAERRLLLRVEALNALNHPQFDEPGPALVNPNFGAITNTLNEGRIFLASLRFLF